jgi:hypothetical protein
MVGSVNKRLLVQVGLHNNQAGLVIPKITEQKGVEAWLK